MTVKAYINRDQTATFICPQCHKPGLKDVRKYIQRNKYTKLKVTCKCGHQYEAELEKRKKFRRRTNLDGIYKYAIKTPDNKISEGACKMTVTNLSFTGLRVKVHAPPRFAVGDKLTVEFKLDDIRQSLVRKDVLVQNVNGFSAGMEFVFNDPYDSSLGFYLLSTTDSVALEKN
jgi:hypothetical protein